MITVKINLENGDSITTNMNCTAEEASNYYQIGSYINAGSASDNLQKIESVDFIYFKKSFVVEWLRGSINDNVAKYLMANDIYFYFEPFGKMIICDGYQSYTYEYKHTSGDFYEITLKEYSGIVHA